MTKKNFDDLKQRRLEANEKLGDLYMKASGRELTAEEKIEEMNLSRECALLDEQMKFINRENENIKSRQEVKPDTDAQFREYLKDVRAGNAHREILLKAAGGNTTANIEASGAINLTIHEMIPTLHEGLGLPVGLNVMTGVEGNEVWPVSINDVEIEEVGEVEALADQVLDFASVNPVPNRIGLTVPVSNMAIDNAAFDLMGFVQTKFGIALREYLAKKIYSQAAWAKNKGPFSGMTAGTIELGANAYRNILAKVAEFSNRGFYSGNVCLSMDCVTEAELKATPKIAGAAGGFVIENGLCAGYPYTVSHYVNTELSSDTSSESLVATDDRYLEIGYWEWFALQQHGLVRLTVDATSQAVSRKNITAITMNSAWSMTDLSKHINGGDPQSDGDGGYIYPSQAFGLYRIVEPADDDEETTTA